ncbi:MAG: hypothetical protein ABWZ79_07035 [Pedobacter agri]|uniref:Sensor of ECF-type sigma factor n=1 Tax=Pedobacter agri TaxID=454586 RepID=A0A9X3DFE7_9SPHI|nr:MULTISPECIES: hypothetical protein [Pedobacter]AZI23906.1 hypothetical protein EA772_00555 [Pedobacter sp. G11]MCX3266150.1 hypothetical protein [Pedobacter agri]MDQ1139906.1 hypothetical protein [Pedobacter agri]
MKNLLFVALMFLLPTTLLAQRPKGEEIESLKIAFFTQKLDLSPEEAKVFWPIYNDMQTEQNALRKERMQKMISYRKTTEIDNLSDAQVQSLITSEFDFKQRDLNLDKKYYNRLKSSLPIKVVGKFYRAQEGFKRELLNRFKGGPKN